MIINSEYFLKKELSAGNETVICELITAYYAEWKRLPTPELSVRLGFLCWLTAVDGYSFYGASGKTEEWAKGLFVELFLTDMARFQKSALFCWVYGDVLALMGPLFLEISDAYYENAELIWLAHELEPDNPLIYFSYVSYQTQYIHEIPLPRLRERAQEAKRRLPDLSQQGAWGQYIGAQLLSFMESHQLV